VGHPRRQRATYRRTHETEQFLSFYDVHSDCLMGTCRRRKTARDIRAAFRRLRACYPRRQRLYVVMDNLNTHWHRILRAFYRTQPYHRRAAPHLRQLAESHRGPPGGDEARDAQQLG
jgi:hypothetical protein